MWFGGVLQINMAHMHSRGRPHINASLINARFIGPQMICLLCEALQFLVTDQEAMTALKANKKIANLLDVRMEVLKDNGIL